MARAYKCDRCGKFFEKTKSTERFYVTTNKERKDLCPECQEILNNFMDNKINFEIITDAIKQIKEEAKDAANGKAEYMTIDELFGEDSELEENRELKLIIDIDKDYYKAICENGYIYDEDNKDIAKIIKDGTLFEEEFKTIKVEIKKLEHLNIEYGSKGYDKYIKQYEVLKIINQRIAELKGDNKQ